MGSISDSEGEEEVKKPASEEGSSEEVRLN